MRVSSYEIGVLVWPALFAKNAAMVATFKRDMPDATSIGGETPIVGLRLPYNLPLQRYGKHEVPWVASMDHDGPDWKGQLWQER